MRVLIAHNFYQQPGGEDMVAANERALLEGAGHEVIFHDIHNDQITGFSAKLNAFLDTPYSARQAARFNRLLSETEPDLVHIHNYFPLFTPAIFHEAKACGFPVVHTLHNFRMMCLSSFLLRDGKICEACIGKTPLKGVVHRCYRGSFSGSLALARMIARQRRTGWSQTVDRFIALTEFERAKFIEGGLPAERLAVKPNFIPDPGVHARIAPETRHGALFVGRLSPEKGLRTLLDAWRDIDYPLRIAGTGPMMAELHASASANVTLLGRLPSSQIYDEMARAAFLVMPSTWYEGFPVTIVESLACGLPILASRLGSMSELIDPGKTGLLFNPGDSADLVRSVDAALGDAKRLAAMSRGARQCYDTNYTAQSNLLRLLQIYQEARSANAEVVRSGAARNSA